METNFANRATTVFLVEDSGLVRERLQWMLNTVPGVRVIGAADNATDAIAGILGRQPDVAVFDLELMRGNGYEVLRKIKSQLPRLVAIALTSFPNAASEQRCIAAGANHVLDEAADFERLPGIVTASSSNQHSCVPINS